MWLLLLACTPQTDDNGEDGPKETGGDSDDSGSDSDTGDSAETAGNDTGADDTSAEEQPVADCMRFVALPACACEAWTIDWSKLTVNLAGVEVTPRTVGGGALYAYALSSDEVEARLCEGSGIDGSEVLDFAFFDVTGLSTSASLAVAAVEGGSLLARIDEPSGGVHMYGLFAVDGGSANATLAITNKSAAWER